MWTFFATHFWTFIASFGVLGVVAVVVCFVLFGWSFGAVLSALINTFKAIVQFFETPLGQVVGIVILCAICWFAADIRRTRIDAKEQRIAIQNALTQAAETAEKNRVERDATIKAEVKQDADSRISGIEAEKAQLEQKAKDYEAELSRRAACTVTDDDMLPDGVRHKAR